MIILGNTKLMEEWGKLRISGSIGLCILITLIYYKWEKHKPTSRATFALFEASEASVQRAVLMYLVPSLIVFNYCCIFKNWNKRLGSYKNFPISSKSHSKRISKHWWKMERPSESSKCRTYTVFLIPSPWQTSLINYRILAHRDRKEPQPFTYRALTHGSKLTSLWPRTAHSFYKRGKYIW